MANGKGSLDCYYCRFYPKVTAMGVEAKCGYHKVTLPASKENRICIHFQPSSRYWADNDPDTPPARRFTWFREDLKPGILYIFMYNTPQKIVETFQLRDT